MEPEDRAVEERDRGNERVAPAHVRLFVREHRRQFAVIPAHPVNGQDNQRINDSDSERCDTRRVRQSALHVDRIAADRTGASPPECKTQEEESDTGDIHCSGCAAPRAAPVGTRGCGRLPR